MSLLCGWTHTRLLCCPSGIAGERQVREWVAANKTDLLERVYDRPKVITVVTISKLTVTNAKPIDASNWLTVRDVFGPREIPDSSPRGIVFCRPTPHRGTSGPSGRRLPGAVVNRLPANPINGRSSVKQPVRQPSPHRSEPVARSWFCGPCGPMSLCSRNDLDLRKQSPGVRPARKLFPHGIVPPRRPNLASQPEKAI